MKLSFVVPALAFNLAAAMPAAAQVAPFEGARVEALVGYDHVGTREIKLEGLSLGGLVGYDWQNGNAVYGFEAEVDGNTTRKTSINDGERLTSKANTEGYVGGRVGYALSSSALVYGKAGYTIGRFRDDYRDANSSGYLHVVAKGFRLGAGIEYKLSRAAYLKGEVRASHYGDDRTLGGGLWREQALVGFGVRF
ncbi:outer membrane protein [Sphingomonas sp. 8AM]|uniref:outer membrane protein n=1 Tax=Sphingomonas sp. 8AM TaxID=2653170 RepID=UPI001358A630|nr:outer membrane beta-barrel protein [Sphingomonas sp. 8AM]